MVQPDDNEVTVHAIARLRRFAVEVRGKGAPDLGRSIETYASRVERVQRGELPATAARSPEMLRPDTVATVLAGGRSDAWFEVIRNVLVFIPVLWTWYELMRAVKAYGVLVSKNSEQKQYQFIQLWQEGFGDTTRTLADTAFVVVVILVVLVTMTLLLGMSRARSLRRHDRIAAGFAVALIDASNAAPVAEATTPNEQLIEFARAGQKLTTELHDLAAALRDSTRPLTDTMLAAQRSIAEVSGAVALQSEQLGRVTIALEDIARTNAGLDSVGASMVTAATALEGIRDSVTPSAQTLVELAAHNAKALENFETLIADQSKGASALEEAASSLNTVAIRVVEELDRR